MAEMGRLEFASPREAWGKEAVSFTPRLAQAELLDYLGRETGIGALVLVEREHTTAGNRSLDILAETPDGRRVAIENQYGAADHDHLTRGLAYAVASDSKALVVVAEDHRDEFISVANYLNNVGGVASDDGVSVWLVKVRAVRRVGDEIWSPEFVVQAEPNEWETGIRRETGAVFASLDDFYEKCAASTDVRWADTSRAIIGEWLKRPGAMERHGNKTTVSLYYPSPNNEIEGTNVAQLDIAGQFRIARYPIWQTAGVFDPAKNPSELDEQIRSIFPNARWPVKGAFIKETNADASQVRSFLDWLVDRFDRAREVPSGPIQRAGTSGAATGQSRRLGASQASRSKSSATKGQRGKPNASGPPSARLIEGT